MMKLKKKTMDFVCFKQKLFFLTSNSVVYHEQAYCIVLFLTSQQFLFTWRWWASGECVVFFYIQH